MTTTTTTTRRPNWNLRDGRIWDGEYAEELVCIIGPDLGDPDERDKGIRYARLIAAAPAMLDALRAVTTALGELAIDLGEDRESIGAAIDQARAAIIAATGEDV